MAYNTREKQNKASRLHYKDNKELYYERKRKRLAEIKGWFAWYKSTCSCEHCDEDDPVCLEFHHKDPSQKSIEVSRAVSDGWSIIRIEKEIEKCLVLCANCHRKIHDDLPHLSYQFIKEAKAEALALKT